MSAISSRAPFFSPFFLDSACKIVYNFFAPQVKTGRHTSYILRVFMADSKFLMKKLLSETRRAVQDYDLIREGDKVCVGVSGGKDSLTLLCVLASLRKFYPKHFDLQAVSVSLGFDNMDLSPVQELCDSLEVPLTIVPSQIADIVFNIRKEQNPCALCANLRRGAVNDTARQLGCNVVALAHHYNDIIETAMLSLMFEGRFYCFDPATELDRSQVRVIRPFLYVEESEIKQYVAAAGIKVVFNPCPMDRESKRAYVKNLISDLSRENKSLPQNIFGAVKRGVWPEPNPQTRKRKEDK